MINTINKSMRTLLLSLLLTSATLHVIFAQTGTITGSVQTSHGKAASMVNIGLEGTSRGTSTDGVGRYVITNVNDVTYTLLASFVGLQYTVIKVVVNEVRYTVVQTLVQ